MKVDNLSFTSLKLKIVFRIEIILKINLEYRNLNTSLIISNIKFIIKNDAVVE